VTSFDGVAGGVQGLGHGGGCLVEVAEPGVQFGAQDEVPVVAGCRLELVQGGQAGGRPVRSGYGGGPVDQYGRGRGVPGEAVVEGEDCVPVRSGLDVAGGDGRLQGPRPRLGPAAAQRRGGEVGQSSEVRVVKRGRGMLYLATTLTHYTNDEQTAEQGVPQLKVRREYLRLKVAEKSDGTLGWQTEPLTGEVRSGDIIVSRIRLEGERAQYLMVEDPIPAGCEQVPSVSGIDLDHTDKDWSDWYSAREFRDNRAVLFLDYFDGSAQFQYAMRVQVPGQFRAAPARAERMYEPDVRANSATAGVGG